MQAHIDALNMAKELKGTAFSELDEDGEIVTHVPEDPPA